MRMSKKKARKLADEWYKRTLEEIRNGTTTGNQSVDYEFESNNDNDRDSYLEVYSLMAEVNLRTLE